MKRRRRSGPAPSMAAASCSSCGLRLQAGEEDEDRERQPAPDARDDDRPHRVGPQQPDRPVAQQVGVVDEDLVDDPDVALPHEGPQHGDHVARHDPRHEHQRPRDALAGHLAVQQQRDGEPADQRARDRPERVDRRVRHRAPEARVQRVVGVQQDRAVVLQAVPRGPEELAEREEVELLEGDGQAADGRQHVHQHHHDQRRRDQPVGQPVGP